MATQIYIYDYTEPDPYWGFEEEFVIGYGKLTAESINKEIDFATGDLDVHINSQGGKVFDGWAIYNKLKAYTGGKVTVYIDGIAASIASIIAMAGESVVMAQASMMMIHKPTSFWCGSANADELQAEANALNEIQAVLVDVYVSKTGLAPAKLQSLIDATTWLSPDSALALGFCDEVRKAENKPTIPQNVFDRLFTNASESTRVYANSAFAIKQNKDMSTVKDLAEKQDKTNSLLTDFLNFFKSEKKNEGGGDEATTTTTTEETTTTTTEGEPTADQLKEENERLKKEAEENKEKVDNAQSILEKANELYAKMESTLAEVKSNYQASNKGTEFNSTASNETAPKSRFSNVKTK